jgi:hypothetical protein
LNAIFDVGLPSERAHQDPADAFGIAVPDGRVRILVAARRRQGEALQAVDSTSGANVDELRLMCGRAISSTLSHRRRYRDRHGWRTGPRAMQTHHLYSGLDHVPEAQLLVTGAGAFETATEQR